MPPPAMKEPPRRLRIQDVRPQVDCGRYAAKACLGDTLAVSATVLRDGHEILGAAVRYRPSGSRRWREAPLRALGNDRFAGSITVDRCGRWELAVDAWVDRFASWRWEIERKVAGGQEDLSSELLEGAALHGVESITLEEALANTDSDRHERTQLARPLQVDVDRPLARFGSWYELFPRSWGGFKGVTEQLPRLAALGFDVVYFPPIHPIGVTNRKGKNNALVAEPGDPCSPWAIGSDDGGHDAVNPELGTL